MVEYHKTRQGWRIAFIRPYLAFAGSYEQGWRHDAATLERAVPLHPDEAGTILPDREAAESRARPTRSPARRRCCLALGTAQNRAAAYGYYLDRGMYDDIADLFAT